MSQTAGYGPVTQNPTAAVGNHVDEDQPLLAGCNGRAQPLPKSLAVRVRKAAEAEVQRDWADIVLIFCYIITGLLDSASISTWGSFVSMQTGNTVYIGLGLAAPTQSTRWVKSATSLLSFCIGSFCFSRFHRAFSPARRATLLASFAAQALLCAGAAAIVTWGRPPADHGDGGGGGGEAITWDVLVPIVLVAFQACGQAVTSRALRYNALTSVVLTSIYCDLFSDARLLRRDNAERNRRAGAPAMLLLGALAGGLLGRSSLGVASPLWVAAALKFGIVVVWSLWPGEDAEE